MSKQRKKHVWKVQINQLDKATKRRWSHPGIFWSEIRRIRGILYWLPKYHGTQFRGMKRWK